MFTGDSRTGVGRHASRATRALLVVLVALVVGMLAAPSRAMAADEASIEVDQVFSTSGSVPSDLGGSFEYELTRTDGTAPLPAGTTGDSHSFELRGTGTLRLPLLVDGTAGPGSILFSHAGIYSYELRCVTDASGTEGLTVDGTRYSIRVGVEDDGASGLRVGWVEMRDPAGEKPDRASFTHGYAGAPAPVTPEEPRTILGIRMPSAGDSLWGLVQLSVTICAIGVAAVVLAVVRRRRDRSR